MAIYSTFMLGRIAGSPSSAVTGVIDRLGGPVSSANPQRCMGGHYAHGRKYSDQQCDHRDKRFGHWGASVPAIKRNQTVGQSL